jgi:hypothetical protein
MLLVPAKTSPRPFVFVCQSTHISRADFFCLAKSGLVLEGEQGRFNLSLGEPWGEPPEHSLSNSLRYDEEPDPAFNPAKVACEASHCKNEANKRREGFPAIGRILRTRFHRSICYLEGLPNNVSPY